MKTKPEPRDIAKSVKKVLAQLNTIPIKVWAGAFFICLIVVLLSIDSKSKFGGSFEEFDVGKVASRDVFADKEIIYRDETATKARIEAHQLLVPVVFLFSDEETAELKNRWSRLRELADNTHENTAQEYIETIRSEFPGAFSAYVLNLLFESSDRDLILDECSLLLDVMLERGIYSLPPLTAIGNLNLDTVELIRKSNQRIEQEIISRHNIVTVTEAANTMSMALASSGSPLFSRIATELLTPFLLPNVFYSREETERNIEEAGARTEPVLRYIEKGKRIVRKDFVISEEEMIELKALEMTLPKNDLQLIFSNVLFLLLLFGLLCYFSGRRIIGRDLSNREVYLVSGLSALYIAGTAIAGNVSIEYMPASVIIPTALVIMLPSILIHSRLALMLAMALPLGAFLAGSFDTQAYIFALVSGVVAAYSLQKAEKRMDLVKAGLLIGAANFVAMFGILLWLHSAAMEYPRALFWAVFNGIASGMLVLGVLPPLEHALNAATTFRLIELSDLNAPVLKRLFTSAPGTYSHSIMVASLAEAACQKIGANYLLARVGAYYHDLGKMENPGYFVENQHNYNCHDDMAPRLSATVIRSHVKLGVEKARQLNLPQEVIDIIGQHHGNSIITWFYDKALKQEENNPKKAPVNADDFRYPGSPPHSRESAVVMLADVTEAAIRTLEKPNAEKMEKFILELFEKKQKFGQLAQSELTFKDLEAIKNAFVQVLAGYYHSRIEYPKMEEQP